MVEDDGVDGLLTMIVSMNRWVEDECMDGWMVGWIDG